MQPGKDVGGNLQWCNQPDQQDSKQEKRKNYWHQKSNNRQIKGRQKEIKHRQTKGNYTQSRSKGKTRKISAPGAAIGLTF